MSQNVRSALYLWLVKAINPWTILTKIPYWVFIVSVLVCGSVAIVVLRENNQHMIKLRNTLYVVDQNNGDVNTALNNLRNYVYAHMNTNLSSGGNAIKPPIQLKYTYQRLQTAAQTAADAANSQVYTDAENYCQIQDSTDFSGHNRVPCVTSYVLSHGGSKPQAIPVGLYEFDFVSPTWSPDLAGWSLAAAALSGVLTVLAFTYQRLLARVR